MSQLLILEPRPGDIGYLDEILRHAGVPFDAASELPSTLPKLVVTVGAPPAPACQRIEAHVRNGGALLCFGSPVGLEHVLGLHAAQDADPGWLNIATTEHPAVRGIDASLHTFGGCTATVTSATVIAQLNGKAALTWNWVGEGVAVFLGGDVPGSVRRIQQGVPVHQDGTPDPDGTAPIDDGILKAEDGLVLDWERDRDTVHVPRGLFPGAWGQGARVDANAPPPDEPQPFRLFLKPVADGLRTLLIQTLLALADAVREPFRMVWYWPRGLDAIAHLSHDSDGNEPVVAERLRVVCRELDIPSTWCMLYPGGYAPAFYRRLVDEGFEVAFHFDAMTGGPARQWNAAHFALQAQWLRDVSGVSRLRSNKNHYTRWEGELDAFHWCLSEGIGLDQSKGPSKTGTVGFPFGTSHPWFPLDDDGNRIDVLELPLMTQDLVITAPAAYAEVLTDSARANHGVAHFLYHPAHIAKSGVHESLAALDAHVRSSGMEWWTAERILDWEHARRAVDLAGPVPSAPTWLEGVTVLELLPHGSTAPSGAKVVERYAHRFVQRVVDVGPA